jgi:hypothetical protein
VRGNPLNPYEITLPAPANGLKFTFVQTVIDLNPATIKTAGGSLYLYGTYFGTVAVATAFRAQHSIIFAATSGTGVRIVVEGVSGTWWQVTAYDADDGLSVSSV